MALSNANTPSSVRPMGGKGTSASPVNTRPGAGKKTPFFAKKGKGSKSK
jgi:hypothetical protein